MKWFRKDAGKLPSIWRTIADESAKGNSYSEVAAPRRSAGVCQAARLLLGYF